MSANSRQNITVGLFALAAVAMIFVVLMYFGGGGAFWEKRPTREATVIFTGSVKGLNVGAPVTLRGVQVGEVTSIDVQFDPEALEYFIPVELRLQLDQLNLKASTVNPSYLEALIQRGLRAQLRTQSLLTGLLYVDLDFQPDTAPRFMNYPTESVQLPTAPTEFEEILQRVSSLDLQSLIQHLDETVQHAGALLGDPELRQVPANLNATLASINTLSQNLDQRTASASERFEQLLASTDSTVTLTRTEIEQLSGQLQQTLTRVDGTLGQIDGLVSDASYTLSDHSPVIYELTEALRQLTQAAQALEALANGLEMHPEALLRGKQEESE